MKNLEFVFLGEILIIHHLLLIENLKNERFWPPISEHIELYGGITVSHRKAGCKVSPTLEDRCAMPRAYLLPLFSSLTPPLFPPVQERDSQGLHGRGATCE